MEQSKEFVERINELTEKIAVESENIKLYQERGECYFHIGNYTKAIADYTQAIEFDSKNVSAHLYLGRSYFKIKTYDEAVSNFNKVLEFDPENKKADIYLNLCHKNLNKSYKSKEELLKPIEKNLSKIPYVKAFLYLKDKEYDEGINLFNQTVESDPEKIENYWLRGIFYFKKQEYNEAIKDFDKAIKLDPEKTESYLVRGYFYHQIERNDEAVKNFDKAVELAPENLMVYLIRRFSYYAMGNYETFLNNLDKESEIASGGTAFAQKFYKFLSVIGSVIQRKEDEKIQLRTDILQAVSHTISNIMLANKSITKRIKNGTNTANDVNRLELLNDLVLSTMKVIKVVFSNEDIVVLKAPDDLSYEKIKDGISLHDLLYFCLNINLYYLVIGEGEEAWATIRNIFFSINRYDKKDVREKLGMLKEMRKSPPFSISELSEEQISGFVNAFQSEQFEPIHKFFAIQIEELRNLYVRKDSYTFSVLFIILLELTKNMIRYGTIGDREARRFTMKSETEGEYVVLTLANVCQKSRLNFKESTLKGLAMIQEFSKVVGKFEQAEKDTEDSELLEFATKLFIKRPEHQETVGQEGV